MDDEVNFQTTIREDDYDTDDEEENEGEEEDIGDVHGVGDENQAMTLMSDSYSDDSDKDTIQIKEDIQRSRATIDGLKLELNMWQKAYKDTQTKNADRIQKLLREYNKRENEIKEKFEQEKDELVEESRSLMDEFKQDHEDLNLLFTTEHSNLNGIVEKLSQEKSKWSSTFQPYGTKLLYFLKSLEGLQLSNDLKEKEISNLRDSQYMKSQEIEQVETELREQLNDKTSKIMELKRENEISMNTIEQLQRSLKKEKDQCLVFEKKSIEQEEDIFKHLHQISRLEKEKIERDKTDNEHLKSLRAKEQRIMNLEKKTRTLSVEIRKQLEEKDRKIDFLNRTMEKVSQEKNKLDQVILTLRAQLNRERQRSLDKGKVQHSEVSVLQSKIKDLEQDQNKLFRKLKATEGKTQHFQGLHAQGERMIELQGKKIEKYQEENDRLLEAAEQIQRTMDIEKRQQKKREVEQEARIKEYQEQIQNLQSKEKKDFNKTALYLKKQIEENKEYEQQLKQTAEKKIQMYERRINRIMKDRERVDSENRQEMRKLRQENSQIKAQNETFRKEKDDLVKSNYNITSILEQKKLLEQQAKISGVEDMKQELLNEISSLREENLTLRDKQLELSEKLLNQTRKELNSSDESVNEEKPNNNQHEIISQQLENQLKEVTKEKDFYKSKSEESTLHSDKRYDRVKTEYETLERKYKIVKDKYFRQSIRQNELQNCLLRMSRFSNMLGTPQAKNLVDTATSEKLIGLQQQQQQHQQATTSPSIYSQDESEITEISSQHQHQPSSSHSKQRKIKKKKRKKPTSKFVKKTLRIRKKKRGGSSSAANRYKNDGRRKSASSSVTKRRSSRSVYATQRGSRSVPPQYRKKTQGSLF